MGSFGGRKVPRPMIQGYSQRVIGAKTIESLCDYLGLVVKTFHAAQGDLHFCPKPVEQEGGGR